MMGVAACSGELDATEATPTDSNPQAPYQDDDDDHMANLDDEQEVEQLVVETAELLTGGYLDDENARMAAEEIFSYPQMISKLQDLLSSTEQEHIDRQRLIYIAGLSGRSEFSDILLAIASTPSLDPESVTEWAYETHETERLAAISSLGRLGDVASLQELLDLVPPRTQRTVWLELHQLDSDRWPMRKLSVEPGERLLSDPDYREMFESLIEGLDVDEDGIVILDDEDDECEELEVWPEDELEEALLECEGEDCDELWDLAGKCDRGCVLGCSRGVNDSQDVETPVQKTRLDFTPEQNNVAFMTPAAQAPRSCPDVVIDPPEVPTYEELGFRGPMEQFEIMSRRLPRLFAALLAGLSLKAGHAGEWCNPHMIQSYKDGYDFDSSWDSSAKGADTPCDLNTALGRMYNAIHLLHTASPRAPIAGYSRYDDLLAEGGSYTQKEIRKMVASCKDTHVTMSVKAKLLKKNRKLTVYPEGFFGVSTAVRAATLVHEARHTQRCRHNGNDGKNPCPSKSDSCDESILDGCKKRALGPGKGQPGAVAYGVKWATLYLAQAPDDKIDGYQRSKVQRYVNYRLNERLDVDPGYNVTVAGAEFGCDRSFSESGKVRCVAR